MTQRPPVSPETITQQLRWRYATKAFDPTRKIPEAHWQALLDALVLSPSSFGLQPWKFIVVNDPVVRAKLAAAAWGQRQLIDASHVVVLAARKHITPEYIDRYVQFMSKVRGVDPAKLKGMRDVIVGFAESVAESSQLAWNQRQVYIALGFLMETAAMLGIDSCPMEGLNPHEFDTILGLTDTDYATVAACPLGYRSPDDHHATYKKVRYDAADLIEYR